MLLRTKKTVTLRCNYIDTQEGIDNNKTADAKKTLVMINFYRSHFVFKYKSIIPDYFDNMFLQGGSL